jgi:hypothetical protein
MSDYIRDHAGLDFARIENGRDVFNSANRQFATLRNGELFSMDGQSLRIHLQDINGGLPISEVGKPQLDAIAKLRNLASES